MILYCLGAPSLFGDIALRACEPRGSTETTERMGKTRSVPSKPESWYALSSLCVTDRDRSLLSAQDPVGAVDAAAGGAAALSDRFLAVPGREF